MRAWTTGSIVICLLAFWLSSRIADNPLVGIVVAAIVAVVLALAGRAVRRRSQANPPKRA